MIIRSTLASLAALGAFGAACSGATDRDAGPAPELPDGPTDSATSSDGDAPSHPVRAPDGRHVQSLNGVWRVAQGSLGDIPPEDFAHEVPVPGLVTSATPPFEDVGVPSERREAFWYRTEFTPDFVGETALIRIHKAKYGIKVWLDGEVLGEHLGPYTLAEFDVSGRVGAGVTHTLTVRVGAHLTSLPPSIPAGQDAEKEKWIPGIWDDVAFVAAGAPWIVRTKLEPDIDAGRVVARTTLRGGARTEPVSLRTVVAAWVAPGAEAPPDRQVYPAVVTEVTVEAGDELTVEQVIPMPGFVLWSPESPELYTAATTVASSDGSDRDALETRFGMREVEWRGARDYGGRFYLNGRPYYLRGSNLSVHRFFEDPDAANHAFDPVWVRKLLSTHPKELAWNAFRISIGRAPNFWYDLFDELGFIIADEFMMWTFIDPSAAAWSVDAMVDEFTSWIQENWNHPSIAWWDASNETGDDKSTQTIERVRHLDATRQWENGGFLKPHRPHDPIEDHPYLLWPFGEAQDDLSLIAEVDGRPPVGGLGASVTYDAPDHPYILNEYAWLWVNRDGTPAAAAAALYDKLLGPGPHAPEATLETYAYLTAGLTELWRGKRGYAGVLHFVYISYSHPGGVTSDNFVDVASLELEPRWAEYAKHAFSPVGVYLDVWESTWPAGETMEPEVWVINDLDEPVEGTLDVFTVSPDREILTRASGVALSLPALGQDQHRVAIVAPDAPAYLVVARVTPAVVTDGFETVYSRRKLGFAHPGETAPIPPYE